MATRILIVHDSPLHTNYSRSWGKELYVDATKVEANASPTSLVPRFAIEAHLRDLFKPDVPANPECGIASDPPPAERTTPADPVPTTLPVVMPEEQWAALVGTNAQRHDWLAQAG